ncbi:MAG: twin-arginine translocase TatA/TatE family subunit [Propionibacterium sp.]|nr:twin-arginine translocase TatA/TatE family subunit [Propionibacterium sp.]
MFLSTTELLIILAVALLIFGGTKLAGLGRGAGRAIREFKEETRGLNSDETTNTTDRQIEADPDRPTDVGDDAGRRHDG